jgi:predicted nucleotidyltransferase
MHKLSKENRRIYQEVIKELKDLVTKTAHKLQPKLVILYGSFVRGDWHPGSDLDILLISDNVPTNFKDRWDILYTVLKGFPVEPHIYTTKEFEEMLKHGRMTVLDALTEGTTLHADAQFMKKTNRILKEVMKKLKPKRTNIGWELTKP